MKTFLIILAAGKSRRFKSKLPKQFNIYKGKMVLEHSINKAINSKIFEKIILVINKSHLKYIRKFKNKKIHIVYGGNERSISSLNAIKYLKRFKPKKNIYT